MLDQRVLGGYVPLRARTAYFDALGGAEVRTRARSPADVDPMHSSGARTFSIVPWQINEGTMTVAMTFSSGAFDFH
jgi:hypothetical protein